MRKSKNLSKAALKVINDINRILRVRGIKDNGNELFMFGCQYLLDLNMYHGYNFFKWCPAGFNPLTGLIECEGNDRYLTLAGSATDFDCLQIYISPTGSIGERLESRMNTGKF